jgi:signal transduction histidine kinase
MERSTPAGDLLRTMSHELRTPLNGIIGYAQLLLRDKTLSPRQATSIGAILESGDQLLALINNLVDLARAEAGEVEIILAEASLRGLVAGVVDAVRARATQKGLEVGSEVPPEMPLEVRVDARRLTQVLQNLLVNAVKFTEHGRVVLQVAQEGPGRLSFSVQDTGRGIAASRLDTIFRPFGRVPGDATRVKDGGLGLALCRELVRLMGGELRVSSELGVGSTFQFAIDGLNQCGDGGQ